MRSSILLPIAFVIHTHAQIPALRDYTLPPPPIVNDALRDGPESSIILDRDLADQFDQTDGRITRYALFHLSRLVRDQAAVDKHNTVVISLPSGTEMIWTKARCITKDDGIIELAPDDIHAFEDAESGSGIRFAFKGGAPGSVLEYAMLTREPVDHRGTRVNLQFNVPIVRETWEMYVPTGWRATTKAYNGAPQPATDTATAGFTRHRATLSDVPALPDETHAFAEAHSRFIIHRMDHVEGRDGFELSGFRTFSRDFHKALYPDIDGKTDKALDAFIKRMQLVYARDEEDKVRTIEDRIKMDFRLARDVVDPGLRDLASILQSSVCDDLGMQRLFCAVLRKSGVAHEVIVTSDRSSLPFDPTFESSASLQRMFIRITSTEKCIAPTDLDLRYGYLPPLYMGHHALVIRNVEVGGAFAGVGAIKPFPALPAETSINDQDLVLTMSDDAFDATIQVENRLSGYFAAPLQIALPYIEQADIDRALDNRLEHLTTHAASRSFTTENAEGKLVGKRPLIIKGRIVSSAFSSLAGEQMRFRIGELLGPHKEVPEDADRDLPVETSFARAHHHTIRFSPPKNWSISGIDGLAYEAFVDHDGRRAAEFRSTATMKDGDLLIDVIERYDAIRLPPDQFNAYRAVLNAAAAFSKASIVLERRP